MESIVIYNLWHRSRSRNPNKCLDSGLSTEIAVCDKSMKTERDAAPAVCECWCADVLRWAETLTFRAFDAGDQIPHGYLFVLNKVRSKNVWERRLNVQNKEV